MYPSLTRQCRDGAAEQPAECGRDEAHRRGKALHREIRVAGEELVGAVAAERHRHQPPRRAADEKGGQQRGIGERLAQPLADRIEGVDEIGRAELDDLVAHPEMARDRYRHGASRQSCRRVTPPPTRTVNAVRSGAASAASAVTRLEIDAARQKHPDRHIGDDLMPHRLAQQLVEPLDRLVPVDRPRRRGAAANSARG